MHVSMTIIVSVAIEGQKHYINNTSLHTQSYIMIYSRVGGG